MKDTNSNYSSSGSSHESNNALKPEIAAGLPSNDRTHELAFTGERLVPGKAPEWLFREHELRYLFAVRGVENRDVLDIACGSGVGTQYLLQAGAKSCVGIDIDPSAVDYARSRYPKCRFMVGDAQNIAIPDRSVEAVVSFETIEHLQDPARFVAECRRVLKPGGKFVCSTPNRMVYRFEKNPYHTHEFLPSEFIDLIGGMFQHVEAYSQSMRCYPLVAARVVRSKIVGFLGVRRFLRRMIPRPGSAVEQRSEYGPDTFLPSPIFDRYSRGWLNQPMYLVVTAEAK